MMRHTETPWEVDDEEIYGDKGEVLICRIPYETNPTGLLTDTDKANAKRIVDCVNRYPILIKSLREIGIAMNRDHIAAEAVIDEIRTIVYRTINEAGST